MDRNVVQSSSVVSIGYDEASSTLEVEFLSASIYQYFGVPKNIFDQLMEAPSKGKFINTYIKNAYAFSRVG